MAHLTDSRHHRWPSLLLLALGSLLLLACDRPLPADHQARSFWAAVNEGDDDSALALVITGDADRQRRQLGTLRSEHADVEALEVPDDAEVALLPTRLVRAGPDAPYDLDTVTVLRRVEGRWRVDLDATTEHVREQAMRAMARRLGDATADLEEAVGAAAAELARELADVVDALKEEVESESDALGRELSDEAAVLVEQVGNELIATLRALETELKAQTAETGPGKDPTEDSAEDPGESASELPEQHPENGPDHEPEDRP